MKICHKIFSSMKEVVDFINTLPEEHRMEARIEHRQITSRDPEFSIVCQQMAGSQNQQSGMIMSCNATDTWSVHDVFYLE